MCIELVSVVRTIIGEVAVTVAAGGATTIAERGGALPVGFAAREGADDTEKEGYDCVVNEHDEGYTKETVSGL